MIDKDKINDDLIARILNTKNKIEFWKVVYSENIPKDLWESYPQINEHFKSLRGNGLQAGVDNVGFLRKREK
ncbi:hypothetical protein B5E58_10860 [Tyzzerella sp. An114]|uniref:hypothetical protein n=1 Tax=Tyzzerella sp. An114 TaxID=1965545 RepID=UPI000B454B98|nr:hypothetical protein [Tyzzerella sp. An114]OUQ56340.1 hypothetical protein B5E58_10860 [Tyzzerella sp. An114]